MPHKPIEVAMEGSCACRAVTYRSGDPVQFVNCHCNLCRSINGAAFSSYVVARSDTVEIVGQEVLGSYAATERSTKHYCTKCGTPVHNSNPSTYPGLTMFYLGTLGQADDLMPGINIFCDRKLPWIDNIASQQSFAQAPRRGA